MLVSLIKFLDVYWFYRLRAAISKVLKKVRYPKKGHDKGYG